MLTCLMIFLLILLLLVDWMDGYHSGIAQTDLTMMMMVVKNELHTFEWVMVVVVVACDKLR